MIKNDGYFENTIWKEFGKFGKNILKYELRIPYKEKQLKYIISAMIHYLFVFSKYLSKSSQIDFKAKVNLASSQI